jgi:hypothetical protein
MFRSENKRMIVHDGTRWSIILYDPAEWSYVQGIASYWFTDLFLPLNLQVLEIFLQGRTVSD